MWSFLSTPRILLTKWANAYLRVKNKNIQFYVHTLDQQVGCIYIYATCIWHCLIVLAQNKAVNITTSVLQNILQIKKKFKHLFIIY